MLRMEWASLMPAAHLNWPEQKGYWCGPITTSVDPCHHTIWRISIKYKTVQSLFKQKCDLSYKSLLTNFGLRKKNWES